MIKHDYGCEYDISIKKLSEIPSEIVREFNCGSKSLDDFIHGELPNIRNSVVYAFFDNENKLIVGFGAICCNAIQISVNDEGNSYTTSVPAIEVDYFAIDERYQGLMFDRQSREHETLSLNLFEFIVNYSIMVAKKYVGASAVTLYSVPRAEHFYARSGFRRFDDFMRPDEKPFFDGCVPMLLEI